MMKAAYKFYQETASGPVRKATNKVRLGELNTGTSAKMTLKNRPKTPSFTAEEQALLQLVNNGQVGQLIAHCAPKNHQD